MSKAAAKKAAGTPGCSRRRVTFYIPAEQIVPPADIPAVQTAAAVPSSSPPGGSSYICHLDILNGYVVHLYAPHPVKPDDGAVPGAAGHQDVCQVSDGHHRLIVKAPRPISGIPEAAIIIFV